MPLASSAPPDTSTTTRRSSLTFKGPAASKRQSKKRTLDDDEPVAVKRRASSGGKGKEKAPVGARDDDEPLGAGRTEPGRAEKRAGKGGGLGEEEKGGVGHSRWRLLSESAQQQLCSEAEDQTSAFVAALPVASSSKTKHSHTELKTVLGTYVTEFTGLLTSLPIPPLPTAIRRPSSKGKGKDKEEVVELGWVGDVEEVEKRIAALESTLEDQHAELAALEADLAEEKRLLSRPSIASSSPPPPRSATATAATAAVTGDYVVPLRSSSSPPPAKPSKSLSTSAKKTKKQQREHRLTLAPSSLSNQTPYKPRAGKPKLGKMVKKQQTINQGEEKKEGTRAVKELEWDGEDDELML